MRGMIIKVMKKILHIASLIELVKLERRKINSLKCQKDPITLELRDIYQCNLIALIPDTKLREKKSQMRFYRKLFKSSVHYQKKEFLWITKLSCPKFLLQSIKTCLKVVSFYLEYSQTLISLKFYL